MWKKNRLEQIWPAEQCRSPALQYGSLLRTGLAWHSSLTMLVEMGTLFGAQPRCDLCSRNYRFFF